jgi:NAD(P)H-dependent flavin oxidoreductase YrpB (nitropropane dioxygenase family)
MMQTRFTRLVGCELPIQMAGMGGVAIPPLVVAVCRGGGLGTLAGDGSSPETMQRLLDDVRAGTDQPFGVNFLMPHLRDTACVDAAAAVARVVEFFYGSPDARLVERVHAAGALACWQVGSSDEAQAAERAGCDLIVAQGVEAGGHIRGKIGLLTLLDQVLRRVAVPVIAAGGIGSGRAMGTVLSGGAAAVRVGTRFVAALESPAHPLYVEQLVEARAEDTEVTEGFDLEWPDAPHRVLRSCIEAARATPDEVIGANHDYFDPRRSGPVVRWQVVTPTVLTSGNIAAMPLWAGESVNFVTSRQPAAKIVRDLVDEAAPLLAHGFGRADTKADSRIGAPRSHPSQPH